MDRDHFNIHQEPGIIVSTGFFYLYRQGEHMARRSGSRRASNSDPEPQSHRKYSRIRSVEQEEQWRTGRKEPGGLLRAFKLKYPNRAYSTKVGPGTGDE